MANFLATTPPLGQQAWGTPHPAAPISLVVTPIAGLGISFGDIGYPPLAAPFRVLILKKYPGTIFPDPKLENGSCSQLYYSAIVLPKSSNGLSSHSAMPLSRLSRLRTGRIADNDLMISFPLP